MKIGGVVFPAFKPYNKSAYEIHISGCTKNCLGCHNKDLQSFEFGDELNFYELVKHMAERRDLFEAISIMGGDLLSQDRSEALEFIFLLRNTFFDKEFWLFTGYEIEELPEWVWQYFHWIKTGPYKQELNSDGLLASSNQKLIDTGLLRRENIS